MLGSAGSYLDGGANAPLQKLALPLMELDFIRKDTWALQMHFRKKLGAGVFGGEGFAEKMEERIAF